MAFPSVADLDEVIGQCLHGVRRHARLHALGVVRDEDGLCRLDNDYAFSTLLARYVSHDSPVTSSREPHRSLLSDITTRRIPTTPNPSHVVIPANSPSSHTHSDHPPSTPRTAPPQYATLRSAPSSPPPCSRGPCTPRPRPAFPSARR